MEARRSGGGAEEELGWVDRCMYVRQVRCRRGSGKMIRGFGSTALLLLLAKVNLDEDCSGRSMDGGGWMDGGWCGVIVCGMEVWWR